MKIKSLTLRNIASIEKADIDFEKGLVDAISGNAAQTFLISGDTGSGKSVIMDGITMALYKETPRLAGVSNPNKNKFKTVSGQEIKVDAIEQYTRIGAAPDDECYSEVLVEANDGKDYCFRLELGYTVKAGEVVHRKPNWLFKPLGGQWCVCKEEIVEELIGQNFDQFRRLSMLAQGQFETFLVGAREEREKILEQLTDTEIYSLYGEAIKRLAAEKKEELTTAQAAYDAQSVGILDSVTVAKLQSELQVAQAEEKTVLAQQKGNDKIITQVDIIDSAEQSKTTATQRKQELEAIVASDDFKADEQLVKDWDDTATERQKLDDRKEAEQKLQKEKQTETSLEEEFERLSSDLEAKKETMKSASHSLDEQKTWLEGQSPKKDMYENAGTICTKIGTYSDTALQIQSISESLATEKGKTADLDKTLKKAEADLAAAVQKVDDIQGQIDSCTEERKKLDPELVNAQIEEVHKKLAELRDLEKSDSDLTEKKETLAGKKEELSKAKENLKTLKENVEKAEEAHSAASAIYEEANGIYATMNASLDEKLVDIRRKLSSGDTCPLCGSVVTSVLSDDTFKESLTPLEQKRDEAKKAMDEAAKELNKCSKDLNVAEGKISSQTEDIDKITKSVESEQKKLSAQASKLGLDPSQSLAPQIAAAITSATSEKGRLAGIQSKAETLQKRVADLLKQRKPLDSARTKTEKVKNEAEKALLSNRSSIESYEENLKKLSARKSTIETEISETISVFFPDWTDDPSKASETLSSESQEYGKRNERYQKECQVQTMLQKTIETINDIREGILTIRPLWDHIYPAVDSKATESEWNNLSAKVVACTSKIASLNSTIKSCNDILSKCPKTENELVAISAVGREKISEIRSRIGKVKEELSGQDGAISSADKQIRDALTILGIADIKDVPAKQELESVKQQLADSLSKLLKTIATISNQLSENDKKITTSQQLKKDLDAANKEYDKWKTLNDRFGGTKLRTIVQTYIMGPLLDKANIYMAKMTDRYELTCSDENEQLAILVKDKYNRDEVRSTTVLSGGERFMISLALSLALSSLNRPGLTVNMLFIDEGFGTLDQNNLESVMTTLETLQSIAGQNGRRVCIISHREELIDRIPVQIQVVKKGSGRSHVRIKTA